MLAIVACSIVPAIRYTGYGMRQFDPAFDRDGARPVARRGQPLRKVQLPLAPPEVMLGVNRTIMMALSMFVITALVGARELGQEVNTALGKAEVGRGPVAGVCVARIALLADHLLAPGAAARKRRTGIG